MKKITVYTKNRCPKCDMTKNVLNQHGITYEIKNVEDDEKAYNHVVETLQIREMPVVEVEGQEPFSGFRPDLLEQLK